MSLAVGTKCAARVIKVLPFGAFVETAGGEQGLLHVSDLDWEPVKDITSALSEGDELELQVIHIEEARIRFSRKALLPTPAGHAEAEAERAAQRARAAEATHLSFSDYDHENERHAEITIWPEGRVVVSRRIETNRDYLATDATIPEDWEEDHEVEFASDGALLAFCKELTDGLLNACFLYYDDGEGLDDDDAPPAIAAKIEAMSFRLEAGQTSEPVDIKALLDFPR